MERETGDEFVGGEERDLPPLGIIATAVDGAPADEALLRDEVAALAFGLTV